MNFRATTIGNICSVLNGRAYKQSELLSMGHYPVLRVGNFFSSDKWYFSDLELDDNKYCDKGDLLFAWSASFGPKIWDGPKVIYHYHIWKMVPNNNVNKIYLYYWLRNSVDTLTAGTHGSVMAHLTKSDMENMPISLPSLPDQQKIAAVLSALDSKIELNTKINNNLEQQFNELYKQYFSSEQSERWDSVPLSEMIFFQEGPGIRNWQYVAENGTKFINIRCINDGDINTATANMISNEEATGKYKHFMLEENDIVMSCSGTLGRYAIVRKEHLPLCLNTSVIRFRSIEQAEDFTYIYGYLTSPEFLNKQAEMACGSVQSNFGPTHLKKITMKKPPKELRLAFHERTRPLLNAIIHNRRESAHLAIVRDALLPKLMSGEIDVSKVDISDPSYLDKLLFSEETTNSAERHFLLQEQLLTNNQPPNWAVFH